MIAQIRHHLTEEVADAERVFRELYPFIPFGPNPHAPDVEPEHFVCYRLDRNSGACARRMTAAGEIENVCRIAFGKQEGCKTGAVIRRSFPTNSVTAITMNEHQRHIFGIGRYLVAGKRMIATITLSGLVLLSPADKGVGIESAGTFNSCAPDRELTLFFYYNAFGKR